MKRITIACGLCALLLGGSAYAAPRNAPRTRPKAAPVKVAPATEVTISEQSGTDVRGFGVATMWTLRSNGTVVREGNTAGMNMGDPGEAYKEHGTFQASDFAPLVAFLGSSRLLNLKVPKPEEMEGTTSVSIVRGGKRRAVVVPDSVASSAAWGVVTLVRGITAGVDWKNEVGLSINTGLRVRFLAPDGELSPGFGEGDFPAFVVRDAKGKQVGVASVSDETLSASFTLAPGEYHLVPFAPVLARPDTKGLIWRATPGKFQVEAGQFSQATITLERAVVAP